MESSVRIFVPCSIPSASRTVETRHAHHDSRVIPAYHGEMPKEASEQNDPLAIAVGLRLVEVREAAGHDGASLARLAGMAPAYLWRIEQGRSQPSLRTLARLAIALEVDLGKLLEGVDISSVETKNRDYDR